MSATPVDKNQARMLVADIGYQETAKRTGIAYATLRQWAKRYQWHKPPAIKTPRPLTVTNVTASPVEAHAEALAEHERETRLSLARASRRMAKDCEELPVRHAKLAHTVAQTMAIVHRQGEGSAGQNFNLNVLNLADLKLTIGGKPVE